MKILKKLGLAILVFVVALVVVSFFLPSKVRVARALSIGAPAEKIFEQINVLKNWEKWSPWHGLDPNMKLQYEGPESGVGAKYHWTSDQRNVGSGTLTITKSDTNQVIQTAMDFREQGQATSQFAFEKAGDGTLVTWSMDSDMGKNPIGKFFGLLMDRMIGADFEKGLNNLQRVCEGK